MLKSEPGILAMDPSSLACTRKHPISEKPMNVSTKYTFLQHSDPLEHVNMHGSKIKMAKSFIGNKKNDRESLNKKPIT
jgi:hypothetical protein